MNDITIINDPQVVIEVEDTAGVVIEVTNSVISLIEVAVEGPQGPQGLQGIAGTGGDLSYTHTQSVPEAIWAISHNLGKRPSTTIIDATGDKVYGNINYIDNNSVVLTFAGAFSGIARFN